MIDEAFVRDKYNKITSVWETEDLWHLYTKNKIESLIKATILPTELHSHTFLFAGSGGSNSGILSEKYIHLDIAENLLLGKENAVVGSIQNIPLQDKSIDYIICVGSVVNYTDPQASIKEFARILKKDGKIILEFEKSDSAEYFLTRHFMRSASKAKTFYQNLKNEEIFVFSENEIRKIIKESNMKVCNWIDFHIASALAYRITGKINFSSKFSKFDKVLSNTFLKRFSCNSFVLIEPN